MLHRAGELDIEQLILHRRFSSYPSQSDLLSTGSKEYDFTRHDADPATGVIQGVAHVVTTSFEGVAELFYSPVSIDLESGF